MIYRFEVDIGRKIDSDALHIFITAFGGYDYGSVGSSLAIKRRCTRSFQDIDAGYVVRIYVIQRRSEVYRRILAQICTVAGACHTSAAVLYDHSVNYNQSLIVSCKIIFPSQYDLVRTSGTGA